MIFAVMEATRKSGRTCEWRIEMKDELFRLETNELEKKMSYRYQQSKPPFLG